MSGSGLQRVAAVLVAAATAIVVLAVAILPFLTPGWYAFAQDRAGATAWTGFSEPDLRTATNALLHDVVIGPPAFDVTISGVPVLEERERAHLRDVRTALLGLVLATIVSAALLGVVLVRAPRASWTWRSMRAGAVGLALATLVVGIVAAVAFEPAFELFHRLLFPSGNYSFDPRTDRLVQLFPEQLWFETALAAGATIVMLAVLVAWLATRRLALRSEAALVATAEPADRRRHGPVGDEAGP